MYIFLGIIFVIIGLIMLISPKTFYQITENWKDNNKSNEPSKSYIISTKFGGCAFLIVGLASIIICFVC